MTEYIVRETGFPGTIKQEVVGEIVRCKDCKHSRTDDSNYDCYRCELTPGRAHFASGFCEKGERRDDAEIH